MSELKDDISYDIHASVAIEASPEKVYAVASDITRMGEWSPENLGGEWTRGEPGAVGSRFLGRNRDGERVWTTECEVVAADPGFRFAWVVLSPVDDADTSVWSFDIEPAGHGSLLTQRYVMRELRNGLRSLLEQMPPEKAETFLEDRRAQLQDALRQTIEGIRKTVENR
ncbi:SRPBCC family protein [Haloactinomyces albus]|uniref:Polyketide cyclase / dehydrase and lipid transport n=1 Tax=Haloactinomyces albus TaxID=1352928 RepID=A0AAE3ZE65_9ACTN|nr:SRPBCC family protein [Haloactinomyces albus]MDR7302250.1 hypothetical protein [Haloactinomyces albus]